VRALLVVNPAAGKRTARDGDLERCIAILTGAGFAFEHVETGADGPHAAELARRAVAERFDSCIVAGGDGTVAPAAVQLLGSEVTLGILPFGSFMNIANGLRLPLAPVEAAHVIARKRVRSADAGEVKGKVFFETAGVGLDAELIGSARHAERGRWRRALRRIVRWATYETHRVTIAIGDEEHTHRAMQVLILNSPYYGWSIEVLAGASMEDGLLDVAVFPRMGRVALLRALFMAWRRQALPGRPVFYRGAEIRVSSEDPIAVHADTMLAGGLPARFVCRKGALRFFG
jgi:diacylglycerol kinase (ATP)